MGKFATSFMVALAVTGGNGGGDMRLLAFTSDTVFTVSNNKMFMKVRIEIKLYVMQLFI